MLLMTTSVSDYMLSRILEKAYLNSKIHAMMTCYRKMSVKKPF